MKKILIICSILALNTSAFALPGMTGILADIGIDGGVHWGLGETNSDSMDKRTMNTASITAMPGYRIGSFMPGIFGEFRFEGQTTKPAEVNDTNFKGSGYLLGVGTTYDIWNLNIMGGISFLGNYSPSKQTIGKEELTYKTPMGMHLKAGYKILPFLTADIYSSFVAYKTVDINNTVKDTKTENDLGSWVRHWNAGIGASVHF